MGYSASQPVPTWSRLPTPNGSEYTVRAMNVRAMNFNQRQSCALPLPQLERLVAEADARPGRVHP